MKTQQTKIRLVSPDSGQETELFVLEQTRISGVDYLLVTDTEDVPALLENLEAQR